MNTLRMALAVFLLPMSILAGLWAGVWWALVGGIVAIVEEIRADELDGQALGIGIARVMLASPIGYGVTIFLAMLAKCLMPEDIKVEARADAALKRAREAMSKFSRN